MNTIEINKLVGQTQAYRDLEKEIAMAIRANVKELVTDPDFKRVDPTALEREISRHIKQNLHIYLDYDLSKNSLLHELFFATLHGIDDMDFMCGLLMPEIKGGNMWDVQINTLAQARIRAVKVFMNQLAHEVWHMVHRYKEIKDNPEVKGV